jgi:hypothetical protein
MSVGDVSALLAEGIKRVAHRAHTEEDLRVGVEALLTPALVELGIDLAPRYERSYSAHGSVLRGRSDAVYGRVVIEYERVGVLDRPAGVTHTVDQLVQYMVAEATTGEVAGLRRAVGVGIDGEHIFFVRLRPASVALSGQVPARAIFSSPSAFSYTPPVGLDVTVHVDGPYSVGRESVDTFLLYLRALRRRPLTPEALADVFGPKGAVARHLVATLYEATDSSHPQVATLFEEWDRLFGIVYGQDTAKAEADARQLAEIYGLPQAVSLKRLLFTVHTYFALFMKLLAAELASLQGGSFMASPVSGLQSLTSAQVRERMGDVEDGGLFARLGVHNFLEGDFFGWYLAVWDERLAEAVRLLAAELSDFEPATGSLEPLATRDLLKKLYQYLVPRRLRHDLGEYYTPDWLADLTLDEAGHSGDLDVRLLDPACGSGTFLVLAIGRARAYADEHLIEPEVAARQILANIVGFDLNPLAVIAARTNYLLALGPLVRYVSPLEIPVYLCDSVLTPAEQNELQATLFDDYVIPSTVGNFHVPRVVVEKGELAQLAALLDDCARQDYTVEEFLAITKARLASYGEASAPTLGELYDRIRTLKAQKRDGLWARIIKNAFAPVFAGRFDLVVGNPPWVNWENLAGAYRDATRALWQRYGLFSLRGHAARLGGGKKDLSMLMLYVAADNYLKDGGRLSFLITQSLFQSKGAGDGFRRFQLGQREHLQVLGAHDLVDMQPFDGASNRTALLTLVKGAKTAYPVPFTVWRRARRGRVDADGSLTQVRSDSRRAVLMASPVDTNALSSPWVTASSSLLATLALVFGPSEYKAYAGVSTWANGVYWVRVLAQRPDGALVVENVTAETRLDVPTLQAAVEADLVFPLLRGRDVGRWQATPSMRILLPQDTTTRRGIPEVLMKTTLPLTYAYLRTFEGLLRGRSGYQKFFDPRTDAFYTVYNVGPYTLARYKVVWPWIATGLRAAVVSELDGRVVIPEHNLSFVALDDEGEADFVCALLNSTPVGAFVRARTPGGGGGLASPSILEHIAIPRFDATNSVHSRVAELGRQARALQSDAASTGSAMDDVEAELDLAACSVWGIPAQALGEMTARLTS